jgi:hypothetical protein
MERVALITVETTFCLRSETYPERCILIVHPDLSVPPTGWKERSETVTVVTPDGREFEATAQISLSHFNIRDPAASIDRRWRVTISFKDITSDNVPDGSQILVSRETREALLPTGTDDEPTITEHS